MSEAEPIILDHSAWNQQDLLLHIIQRYFDLGNEAMAGQAWEVRAKSGRSESEALIQLNEELEPLGYLSMLDRGNPPILSVAHYPAGQQVIANWQLSVVWLMMAGFLTMIGSAWLMQFDSSATAFDSDILEESLIFLAIPMMLILGLASEVRRRIALLYGVKIGHVVPIAFPIMAVSWPFGLAGVLSQHRADLIPIPNRRALAVIESTVPIILFLGGSLLTIVGLHLTPLEPPELSSSPIGFQNNVLISILTLDWLGDDLLIKLQWIHLTGLAGIGLTLIGWTLLLPIPGFPGDRLLHALIGPAEMSDSNRQTGFFILMLGAMVMIFANTDYMPWLLIAALAAMRRFSPENTPPPLVVDESIVPTNKERSRFATLLVFLLIMGFPGLNPSFSINQWDEGLDSSGWVDEIELEVSETYNLTLDLTPEGINPVSGWIQIRVEGENSQLWDISSSQFNENKIYRFDGVTQNSPDALSMTIIPMDIAQNDTALIPNTSMWLRILVDVDGHVEEHLTVLRYLEKTSPIDPLWLLIEDTVTPRICMSIQKVDDRPAFLSLSNPFWEFENHTNLSQAGLHDVCLRGYEGALQSSQSKDEFRRIMGPELTLNFEDGEQIIWLLAVNGTEPKLQISDAGWQIPEWDWFSHDRNYTITYASEGSAFCPSSEIMPEMEIGNAWNWTFTDRSSIRIPAGQLGFGTLFFDSNGWLAFCEEGIMLRSYMIVEGDDVVLIEGDIGQNLSSDDNYYKISNRMNKTLPITVSWTGDSPDADVWSVSIQDEIAPYSESMMILEEAGTTSLYRSVWVTVVDGEITVNLAARCPVDGCE